MRITNSMMCSDVLYNLNTNLQRLSKWNNQMSTGKQFNKPSDNPIAVSKSLQLHTSISKLEQYKKNAQDVQSWLEITESAVYNVVNVLQRARELTVSADGTETKEDKEKIQIEIDQLKEELIKISNSTYSGKHIFSGYHTDKPLLNEDGSYNVASDQSDQIEYMVGIGDDLQVNTIGARLFGVVGKNPTKNDLDHFNLEDADPSDPNKNQAQLIKVFEGLSDALKNDDADGIQDALGRMDVHLENVLSVQGEIGVKSNRMEMTVNRIDKDILDFTKLLSLNEDVDMSQLFMKFKNDENVYRSALSAGSKVIQPSLVDFIK